MSPNLDPVTPAQTPGPTLAGASRTLLAAAFLAGLQALGLVGYGLAEIGYGVARTSGTGIAVGLFLGAYGVAIGLGVRFLLLRRSTARAPLVCAQLLHLGLAWNMRDAPLTPYAIGLALWAVLLVAALLAPGTTRDLTVAEEEGPEGAPPPGVAG